ncbi:MAG: DUF4347 domain-containing protein [Isosphaeraceae bacterium]
MAFRPRSKSTTRPAVTPDLLVDALERRTLLNAAPAPRLNDATAPFSVVLVSDAVAGSRAVVESAAAGVVAVSYNAATDDTSSLVDRLEALSRSRGNAPIAALGIVAHGHDGAIALTGRDAWTSATLPIHAADLARLGRLLTDAAVIDVYSCDVAATDAGRTFVADLSRATGADVRASDDPVGTTPDADLTFEFSTTTNPASTPLLDPTRLGRIHGLKLDDRFELQQRHPSG